MVITTASLISIILSVLPECAQSSSLPSNNVLDAHKVVSSRYEQLIATVREHGSGDRTDLENQLIQLLDGLFDTERMTHQLFQNEWESMTSIERERLIRAFKVSMSQQVVSEYDLLSRAGLPSLILESETARGRLVILNYLIDGGMAKRRFTIKMLKRVDDTWKVSSVGTQNGNVLRYYFRYVKTVLDDYSIAYLIAKLTHAEAVILEDFESTPVGELPGKWRWKSKDDKKHKPYKVLSEHGNKYLSAEDNGESVILGKDITWNLNEYPYLSFRWRVHKVPEGGDERFGKSVDSAAGVYVVYKKKMGLIPESIKYVWSSTLPIGSAMRRSGIGRPWMIVADSGVDSTGVWKTYVFDLLEAYEQTFGGAAPDTPIGIAILSDANSTGSMAYADYDDFRVLNSAQAGSGIVEFLKAE